MIMLWAYRERAGSSHLMVIILVLQDKRALEIHGGDGCIMVRECTQCH